MPLIRHRSPRFQANFVQMVPMSPGKSGVLHAEFLTSPALRCCNDSIGQACAFAVYGNWLSQNQAVRTDSEVAARTLEAATRFARPYILAKT